MKLGKLLSSIAVFPWLKSTPDSSNVTTVQAPMRFNIDHESLKILVPMSRYTQIAYCLGTMENIRPGFYCRHGCTQFLNTELLYSWHDDLGSLTNGTAAGYIAADHDRKWLILQIRGAHSLSELVDFWSLAPEEYVSFGANRTVWLDREQNPFFCTPEAPDEYNMGQMVYTPCLVHSGYMRLYRQTMGHLLWDLEEYVTAGRFRDYRVFVAGHGVGGVLASLIGLDLQMRGYNNTIISFGASKFGNQAFANYFDQMRDARNMPLDASRNYFRVTKPFDPYIMMPPTLVYHHTAGEVFISDVDDDQPREDDTFFCPGQRNPYCSAATDASNPLSVISWLFFELVHLHYFTELRGCAIDHAYIPLRDIEPADMEEPYNQRNKFKWERDDFWSD